MSLGSSLPLHCAAIRAERDLIVSHHDLPTSANDDITLYGSGCGERLVPERGALANAIADAYTRPVDFPRLVRQAYADGARVFIEMGPRRICSTWIDEVLAGRPHLAVPLDLRGVDDELALLRGLAQLVAHQVPVDLQLLYESPVGAVAATPRALRRAPNPLRLAGAAPEVIENLIAEQVAEILGCAAEMVDRNAPLLHFGIDSLAVAGLAQSAERDHGVRLELADVVEAGTIRGLAELVQRRSLAIMLTRPAAASESARLRI
jgi:aryl carrier-like protein